MYTGRGKGKLTHIIVQPDTFRDVVMMLETKKSCEVCKYYIQLEHLINIYSIYQTVYHSRQTKLTKQVRLYLRFTKNVRK